MIKMEELGSIVDLAQVERITTVFCVSAKHKAQMIDEMMMKI